jgi:nicotinate-nucleotide pyrophosphorylase (carboxylating)
LTWLEASGGIHLGNVKKYAATGVEIISIGELTDSIESVDISLEVLSL